MKTPQELFTNAPPVPQANIPPPEQKPDTTPRPSGIGPAGTAGITNLKNNIVDNRQDQSATADQTGAYSQTQKWNPVKYDVGGTALEMGLNQQREANGINTPEFKNWAMSTMGINEDQFNKMQKGALGGNWAWNDAARSTYKDLQSQYGAERAYQTKVEDLMRAGYSQDDAMREASKAVQERRTAEEKEASDTRFEDQKSYNKQVEQNLQNMGQQATQNNQSLNTQYQNLQNANIDIYKPGAKAVATAESVKKNPESREFLENQQEQDRNKAETDAEWKNWLEVQSNENKLQLQKDLEDYMATEDPKKRDQIAKAIKARAGTTMADAILNNVKGYTDSLNTTMKAAHEGVNAAGTVMTGGLVQTPSGGNPPYNPAGGNPPPGRP